MFFNAEFLTVNDVGIVFLKANLQTLLTLRIL